MLVRAPTSTLFPYTTLFRSGWRVTWTARFDPGSKTDLSADRGRSVDALASVLNCWCTPEDRKSTRLNSSHLVISYAVFCLKKKKKNFKQIALEANVET